MPFELHKQQNCAGSPLLTSTLKTFVFGNVGRVLHLLLDLLGGFHFQGIRLLCYNQAYITAATELVVACSDTLECFNIECDINSALVLHLR